MGWPASRADGRCAGRWLRLGRGRCHTVIASSQPPAAGRRRSLAQRVLRSASQRGDGWDRTDQRVRPQPQSVEPAAYVPVYARAYVYCRNGRACRTDQIALRRNATADERSREHGACAGRDRHDGGHRRSSCWEAGHQGRGRGRGWRAFKQTVRVWRGRPVVEVEIELDIVRMPDAEPWHNYFTSRFAWHDETASLTRSAMMGACETAEERIESLHYLEIATPDQRTTILTAGLPFHRKTGPRMIDTILVVPRETERKFRFTIAIDQDYPMQAALDALSSSVVVPTRRGPPKSGAAGWFFHLATRQVQIVQMLPLMAKPAGPAPADSTRTFARAGENLNFARFQPAFRTPTGLADGPGGATLRPRAAADRDRRPAGARPAALFSQPDRGAAARPDRKNDLRVDDRRRRRARRFDCF